VKIAGEFIKYSIAGFAAAATHLAVLAGLVQLMQAPKTMASAIGFCCAIPVNYFIQHRFVFGRTGGHTIYFMRYITVTLILLAANVIIFSIFTQIIGIFYVLAQILVIGIVFVLNFLVNRTFTFSDGQRLALASTHRKTSGGK
jgi:putative flippase GtrA